MDGGRERLDRQALAPVREQARRVHWRAALATLAFTVAALALP